MYRISNRRQAKRRRSRFWLLFTIFFALVAIGALVYFLLHLNQKPVITQSKAVITKVTYQGKTKHYNEGDFSIDLPIEWQPVARPPYTYQSFTWQSSTKGDSEIITIYEDTIPDGFSVNRALIIRGSGNRIDLMGQASDNCEKFATNGSTGRPNTGVPAKWQNVDFSCNLTTTARDVVGTSSIDGVNTVNVKGSNGVVHKFLFTYTDSQLSPDYTVFYNTLSTFVMK